MQQTAIELHLSNEEERSAQDRILGIGVGLAAMLGIMRFTNGWSLKPLIYWSVGPTLLVSAYAHFHPELSKVIGLAWDCGGVTTGPVTVPLVLAFGLYV